MVEVDLDFLALADPAHGGDHADGGVGLDQVRRIFPFAGRKAK